MSSREALLSALAVVAFGAVASSASPAEARTSAADVCAGIVTAQDVNDVRRHLGNPDCGAVAVGRLLELQGGLTRIAQAGEPPLVCLYKPDDPRYRLDPRCPPLILPSGSDGSSSGSGSSGGGGGYSG